MPNHFHLLIQIRDENTIRISANNYDESFDFHKFIMQKLSNFLNSYAKAFNKQRNRKGALFLDFKTLCTIIFVNSQQNGIIHLIIQLSQ